MNTEKSSSLALLNFSLDSSQKWSDEEGNIYIIKVHSFQAHDHSRAPIYYLDYPLDEKVRQENAETVVVRIECNSDGLPSPYSGIVENRWIVCRKNVDFEFVHSISEHAIQCTIMKKDAPPNHSSSSS